jgi:TrmH family RNA methyltransferase
MIHETWQLQNLLAEIRQLQTNRAYRNKHRTFFVEGVRNFIWAVDHQLELVQIIYSEKLLTAPTARKLVRQARRNGISCLSVSPEQFRQISSRERVSGIGAIVKQPWSNLEDVVPRSGICWLVLEKNRSPGNLGTLIRTSEAFGGAGFIFVGHSIDPFAPDVVRASMGGVFCQQFVRSQIAELQAWVKQHHCIVIGASPQGTTDLHQLTYPQPTLLFLGEERQGLTSTQASLCQQLVRIPMVGAADSLNLAIAGSLMLYEIHRARLVA